MNGPSPILLATLIHDAGFVVERGETEGWLTFAMPGRDLAPRLSAAHAPYLAWHRDHVFRAQ